MSLYLVSFYIFFSMVLRYQSYFIEILVYSELVFVFRSFAHWQHVSD